ncbi:MAG: hypothetical protein J5497_06095, partial [Selenomonadaceae bacterium]|nr:hypothetical protein [Selenomonadaceae bacterium]
GGGLGTYFAETIKNDIVLTVGDDLITLKGAANLSKVNIDGVYKNPLSIVGTNGADNIINTLNGATIQALSGNDTITNSGASVIITGGKGNDSITNTGAGGNVYVYNAKFGDDTINGFNDNDTILIADTFDAELSGDVLTIKKGDVVKGTIKFINGSFTTTNVVKGTKEDESSMAEQISGLTYNEAGGYYEIATPEDLQALATYVNGGGDTSNTIFRQTADIDLSGIENFTPIGTSTNPFYGVFDGGIYDADGNFTGENRTISNLTINNPEAIAQGLFGVNSGTILSVNLVNANVTGADYVGGLVGYNYYGKIQFGIVCGANVTSSGTVGGFAGANDGGSIEGYWHKGDSTLNAVGASNGEDNITELYKLTLPQGILADGIGLAIGENIYVIAGDVTFASGVIADNASWQIDGGLAFNGTALSAVDGVYTANVTSDATIDATTFIGVNGGEFVNEFDNVSIVGSSAVEQIANYGSSVFIDGGDDADVIGNAGTNVTINGGDGNDEIENYISNVIIDGGKGNDAVLTVGDVLITTGEGSDTIQAITSASGA